MKTFEKIFLKTLEAKNVCMVNIKTFLVAMRIGLLRNSSINSIQLFEMVGKLPWPSDVKNSLASRMLYRIDS